MFGLPLWFIAFAIVAILATGAFVYVMRLKSQERLGLSQVNRAKALLEQDGLSHKVNGHLTAAIQELQSAQELVPGMTEAINTASIKRSLKDAKSAIAKLEKSLGLRLLDKAGVFLFDPQPAADTVKKSGKGGQTNSMTDPNFALGRMLKKSQSLSQELGRKVTTGELFTAMQGLDKTLETKTLSDMKSVPASNAQSLIDRAGNSLKDAKTVTVKAQ